MLNLPARMRYVCSPLRAAATAAARGNDKGARLVAGMESIKDYEDIFGSPKMSFGPRKRQGSNESFLVTVHEQRWVPAQEAALSY